VKCAKHGRGVDENRDPGVESIPGIEKKGGHTAKTSSQSIKMPRLPTRPQGLGNFARGSKDLI
jgi:hypothetical protein